MVPNCDNPVKHASLKQMPRFCKQCRLNHNIYETRMPVDRVRLLSTCIRNVVSSAYELYIVVRRVDYGTCFTSVESAAEFFFYDNAGICFK